MVVTAVRILHRMCHSKSDKGASFCRSTGPSKDPIELSIPGEIEQIAGIYNKMLVSSPSRRMKNNLQGFQNTPNIYLDGIHSPCDAIIFCLCLGFNMWYSLLPEVIMTLPAYNCYEVIINPEVIATIRKIASVETTQITKLFLETCANLSQIWDGVSPTISTTGIPGVEINPGTSKGPMAESL
jgi:hypothetical protein